MPQIGQAQSGTLKSTPKLTRINGDDNLKVIYRNMGNNHAYPFIWASTVSIPVGDSSMVVASGIKWHGYDLATYASVVATADYNAGNVYITKDTAVNTVTLNVETAPTVSGLQSVSLLYMLGDEMEAEGLYCRGNHGAAPNWP